VAEAFGAHFYFGITFSSQGYQKNPCKQRIFLILPPAGQFLSTHQLILYSWSGKAESNCRYTHPKGADYHYPIPRMPDG